MAQQTKLKSAKSFVGLENADIRNVAKAMGYSDDDLTTQRPVIGIANSWNTFIPGHSSLNQISEQVNKGIHRAGGTVFELGLIGLCAAVQGSDLRFGGDYGRSQSHRWDCAIGILR